MKHAYIFLLAFLIIINTASLYPQGIPLSCDGPYNGNSLCNGAYQFQGVWRTSLTPQNQFFRVLVVFVRFAGDNSIGSNWPDPTQLPYWASHIVDSDVQSIGSTDVRNLSTYFNESSYGKYKLIGDVCYVQFS